jgi:hypothetical protein
MATFLYDTGRDNFANGNIDWVNDDIRLIFIDDSDYIVDSENDATLADIGAPARVATSAASLSNKSTDAGICDADDHTIDAVSGDEFEAIVIVKYDTGTPDNSLLIAYIDNYSGLPATPNAGNITVAFPNDANKIFKL